VDQVVDAHALSDTLGRDRFDAVSSYMVFEHLAMPWKAAVELNRVLEPGGLAYVMSTQSCGLHDMPCDYFRFSDDGYRALFNAATGFEIVELCMSVPMHVVPFVHQAAVFTDVDKAAGFFVSEVIAKKIGETTLDWPVPLAQVSTKPYPA
jgi:hypothetical protein